MEFGGRIVGGPMGSETDGGVVVWVEPGPDDQPVLRREDAEKVVWWQRSTAAAMGHAYVTADAALADFMAINWAWLELEDDMDGVGGP